MSMPCIRDIGRIVGLRPWLHILIHGSLSSWTVSVVLEREKIVFHKSNAGAPYFDNAASKATISASGVECD